VLNVISGERYKIVPKEIKDYVKGMYGNSPAKMEKSFVEKILDGEKPVKHRPADDLEPILNTVTDDVEPKFITQDEDILSYAMFPEVAAEFFKWRAANENEREPIPADLELQAAEEKKQPDAAPQKEIRPLIHNDDYHGIGYILSQSSGIVFDEFVVKKGDFSVSLKTGAIAPQSAGAKSAQTIEPKAEKVETPPQNQDYVWTINSPITGTFYCAPGPGKPKYVEIGKAVKTGDVVCTVEAMKLFNEIKSDKDGTVTVVLAKDGEIVQKGQALVGMK